MSNKGRSDDDGGGDEVTVHAAGVDEVPNKQRRYYGEEIKRAKQVIVSPFRNVKKKLSRRKKPSSSATPPPPGEGSCYFCFMRPLTSDSPVCNSQTSDPMSPEFSYDTLKSLIEKNDFFSRECNVHIDIS